MTNAIQPRSGARDAPDQEVLQRPRGLHARRRVHPRRVRGAGLLGRRRLLRARPRGRRRHRQDRWPSGSSTASRSGRSGRSTSAASAATYASQRYTLARTYEALSKYYDIKYPGEERKAGRPLRVSPAYARHAALGAAFGEKSGWERVNWYESNAAARRRVAAAARLGRARTGRRRSRAEAAATPRPPRACSTSPASRSSRWSAPARSALLRAALRQRRRRGRSGASPTRRCSTTAAASSATCR